jgi:MEMO1 family protein
MKTRKMICAGKFYPSSERQCLSELKEMFDAAAAKTSPAGEISGGIVPHAGWVFSGKVAAEVFEAISRSRGKIDTFILFGACHSSLARSILVYDGDKWQSPLGDVEIDKTLADEMSEKVSGIVYEDAIHSREHSIEVNIPLIKYKFPEARIIPVIMPAKDNAQSLREMGEFILGHKEKKIAVIGSSDLTHYGSDYGFTPAGEGEAGCKWAKEVNDTSLIQSIEDMDAGEAAARAIRDTSACGPFAIAAAISVCKHLGATAAVTLEHTHSREIVIENYGVDTDSSVGYAGIVFKNSN